MCGSHQHNFGNASRNMSDHRFVTNDEYAIILARVNQVICQYSNSSDKSIEASMFVAKIEEKSNSREVFLKSIEERLDLIDDPKKVQEFVEWFKVKRSSLQVLMQGLKEKLTKDPMYLSKYSSTFTKGMQYLERLLKVDPAAIGTQHYSDISRIRKAMQELKEQNSALRSQQQLQTLDQALLYSTLQDCLNLINATTLLSANPTDARNKEILWGEHIF